MLGGKSWTYHMGDKPQRDGTIFMKEVDPSRHHEKFFNLAIGGGLGWIKGLKNGARKSYISCNYSFCWKFHCLSQSTFILSMLESQSWKNKMVTEMWRLKRWCYLSKTFFITITSFNFFNCPVTSLRSLRSSKFLKTTVLN